MKKEVNDEQLILQYAQGESAAFEVLYQRHKASLFRYCLRQFSSRAVAEECFQDIWMKIIRNRVSYKPKALFTTYLYRIATNQVIDLYRKEKKRLKDCEYNEESFDNLAIEAHATEQEHIERKKRLTELRKQIGLLPFEQRNTLLLKIDGGLSIEEIGLILDCGKETVKSRLRYATNKLKGSIRESLELERS
ncbi:MAG: sigma-70 family RNA polymerase sigma factor [Kangiellaceae bacterium]|nr:sigma-70 family RNA polymerase sigma factor [Kangiellaceae bacterium]